MKLAQGLKAGKYKVIPKVTVVSDNRKSWSFMLLAAACNLIATILFGSVATYFGFGENLTFLMSAYFTLSWFIILIFSLVRGWSRSGTKRILSFKVVRV